MAKKQAKAKQHPEAELLTNMSKKQVCLYQRDYMINCNANENDNGKIGHTNKKYIKEWNIRDSDISSSESLNVF